MIRTGVIVLDGDARSADASNDTSHDQDGGTMERHYIAPDAELPQDRGASRITSTTIGTARAQCRAPLNCATNSLSANE
jgi:hypothetical protein